MRSVNAVSRKSTLSVAGRVAPTAKPDSSSTTASGRPWQLDDHDWLAHRYAKDGDRIIARELGCAPNTVTRARQRLGIASLPNGRRRSQSTTTGSRSSVSLASLIERFGEDRRHRTPATDDLLIARCKAWLDAKQHHDQLATEDALLSIASAALLVHEHQLKLRKVA